MSKRSETYGFPALVELLIAKLKVVPLSSRRFPPVRLNVELPCADELTDVVICIPRSDPVTLPAVSAVAPTVLPTALLVVPATVPTVDVVALTTPPATLPTPPSRPPLLLRAGEAERADA